MQQKSNEREKDRSQKEQEKREGGGNMGQRKIAHNVFLFLTDEKKKTKKK